MVANFDDIVLAQISFVQPLCQDGSVDDLNLGDGDFLEVLGHPLQNLIEGHSSAAFRQSAQLVAKPHHRVFPECRRATSLGLSNAIAICRLFPEVHHFGEVGLRLKLRFLEFPGQADDFRPQCGRLEFKLVCRRQRLISEFSIDHNGGADLLAFDLKLPCRSLHRGFPHFRRGLSDLGLDVLRDRNVTTWQIVLFGLTGGLIPCPAAITVLLLSLQLKEFTLGFTLVLCFSIGLAITLVSVGAAAALSVRHATKRWSWFSTFARRAPYFSGILLIGVGLYVGIHGWMGLSSPATRAAQAALVLPLGG